MARTPLPQVPSILQETLPRSTPLKRAQSRAGLDNVQNGHSFRTLLLPHLQTWLPDLAFYSISSRILRILSHDLNRKLKTYLRLARAIRKLVFVVPGSVTVVGISVLVRAVCGYSS